MSTQVDGFTITSELVSLLKRWKSGETPETYSASALDIQDFLSRMIGESLYNPKELMVLSEYINILVGLRDEFKQLHVIFNANCDE